MHCFRPFRKHVEPGDATCTIVVSRPSADVETDKPKSAFTAPTTAARQRRAVKQGQVTSSTTLTDLPAAAFDAIWWRLDRDTQANARLVSRLCREQFSSAVHLLQLTAQGLRDTSGLLLQLHQRFTSLNKLHLNLSHDKDDCDAELLAIVRSVGGHMRHLHTLAVDGKLSSSTVLILFRFIASTPSITRVLLPQHSCASASEQKCLAGLLDALPGLVQLDLGSASSAASSSSRPLGISIVRRIGQLRWLRSLCCNASGLGDKDAQLLSGLTSLESLAMTVGGCGTGLAAVLGNLTRLTYLELESETLADSTADAFQHLPRLQTLAVGLCPNLTAAIVPQVRTNM